MTAKDATPPAKPATKRPKNAPPVKWDSISKVTGVRKSNATMVNTSMKMTASNVNTHAEPVKRRPPCVPLVSMTKNTNSSDLYSLAGESVRKESSR